MLTYIILNVRTREMIECHDEMSREWGEGKVACHNSLFPNDQWVMVTEVL